MPVNNMPPQFGAHISEILVSQGGSVPIGQSQLQISDPDTPLSELRMSVGENPVNGVIEKVQDGLKVLLRKGNVIFFLIFSQLLYQGYIVLFINLSVCHPSEHSPLYVPGDKNTSILHLSCRTRDLQFSHVLQTHVFVR